MTPADRAADENDADERRRSEANLAEETVADARWFPLRYDLQNDAYHFVFIPAEVHRNIAFLNELKPARSETRVISRAAVAALIDSRPDKGALHLILHSGLGGSTFVARALGQPGTAVPLLEPPILNDVLGYGLRTSGPAMQSLLAEVTQLMARPHAAGEAVICKLSGIGNGVAGMMASVDSRSQILCLQNPLEQMLASFAARGASGRMAGRQLLINLRNSRMSAFQMTDRQLLDHTDFQMAALGWLSIQKIMATTSESLGPDRAASLRSDQLLANTATALAAVSSHFHLDLDIAECIARGVLDRHAKSGEPFDAQQRARKVAEALQLHHQEIQPVVGWARKIAQSAEIAWDLPYPLVAGPD